MGEEAKQYKINLINAASPDLIIGLGDEGILKNILEEASKPYVILDAPSLVRKRTQEERRTLREDSYRNYLKNGKILVMPITQVEVNFFNDEATYESNTLLGLLNEDKWLIGLGVFKKLDKNKFMRIYTPAKKEDVKIVEFSGIKVNEEGRELNKILKEKT